MLFFKNINAIVIGIIFLGFLQACNKDDDNPGSESFDRGAMLSNIGSNIIIPGYVNLKENTDRLNESVTAFNASPNSINLQIVQDDFKEAFRAWQNVSVFEIGPAEAVLLRANLNTFPTDPEQINSNITSGNYNLGTANNLDAKGFPGLDYMLFGLGQNEEEIITAYTTNELAGNRKIYLSELVLDIKSKVDNVVTNWQPDGGNYLNTFINAQGTDVGSSLGQLVNELNYDFEIIKNPKLGIPLGKKTLGITLPANVEAYYSGISAELALLNAVAIENVYLGKSMNRTDGIGLDDYLVHLQAQHNNELLSTAIKNQFAIVKTRLEQVPDPLSATIENNYEIADAAYNEIQKTVVLIKTDMPSAMGVLITYQDNDGD